VLGLLSNWNLDEMIFMKKKNGEKFSPQKNQATISTLA